MTFGELKMKLESFTEEQLKSDVVWVGDERGGKVHALWIAEEDWIEYDGDCESRSSIMAIDPDAAGQDAPVYIAKGTPQLLVTKDRGTAKTEK